VRHSVEVEIGGRTVQVPRWGVAVLAACILGAGGLAAYLLAMAELRSYSDQKATETEASAVVQCDGANLQRSYELANDSDGWQRQHLAEDLQPIINCTASIPAGRRIPVTKSVQDRYVQMVVERRCWPTLGGDTGGEIVGCRELPSASQLP
jgi:hypothetical protein